MHLVFVAKSLSWNIWHLRHDHPQFEICREAKHGIVYRSNEDEMNIDSRTWVVGRDYSAAPTCATCHVSATMKDVCMTSLREAGKIDSTPFTEHIEWTCFYLWHLMKAVTKDAMAMPEHRWFSGGMSGEDDGLLKEIIWSDTLR